MSWQHLIERVNNVNNLPNQNPPAPHWTVAIVPIVSIIVSIALIIALGIVAGKLYNKFKPRKQ